MCCWPCRGRRALRWSRTSHLPSALEHTWRKASHFLSFKTRLANTHRNRVVNQSNARQWRQFRTTLLLQTDALVWTARHRADTSLQPEGWDQPLRVDLLWERTKWEPAHGEINSFPVPSLEELLEQQAAPGKAAQDRK